MLTLMIIWRTLMDIWNVNIAMPNCTLRWNSRNTSLRTMPQASFSVLNAYSDVKPETSWTVMYIPVILKSQKSPLKNHLLQQPHQDSPLQPQGQVLLQPRTYDYLYFRLTLKALKGTGTISLNFSPGRTPMSSSSKNSGFHFMRNLLLTSTIQIMTSRYQLQICICIQKISFGRTLMSGMVLPLAGRKTSVHASSHWRAPMKELLA